MHKFVIDNMGRNIGSIVCSALLIIITSGCQKIQTGNQIGTSISTNVSSNETKGKIITTTGINADGQTFTIHGYLDASIENIGNGTQDFDKTHFHFINDVLKCTGSSWDWLSASGVDANRPKWRSGLPIRFWSSYPEVVPAGLSISWPHIVGGDTPTNVQQKTVELSYELPAPAGAHEDATDPFKDAENQIDILFAYNEETRFFKKTSHDEDAPLIVDQTNPGNKGTRNDDKIDIHFYHVLSAVNFDITTMNGTVDFGLEPSITINHVRYRGTCTIDGPSLSAPDPEDIESGTGGVTWSNLSTDFKDFSQSFNKSDDFETIETSGLDPKTYVRQNVSGPKTFFMIPQTLSDASLSVAFNYKNGGVPITLTKNLDADVWLPGKIYTYSIKLTANDGVYTLLDVTLNVNDWVDGKKDISF